jgi:hypothetical protein
MPSLQEAYRQGPYDFRAFKMNGSGAIFEHFGRIPENVFQPSEYQSSLEAAVHKNDLALFKQQVQEGQTVSVRLKVGQMTCIEYAAMRGYVEVLQALLDDSVNSSILKEYFSLDDVVDRAYLISRNKKLFFDREGLAEANRYEAALYTSVAYNQPACVKLMLSHLGARLPRSHNFYTQANQQETLSPAEFALVKGHTDCYNILMQQQTENQVQRVQAC